MLDLLGRLSTLRRPRLLIRAARIGARQYSRNRHLPRLLGYGSLPKTPPAVLQLIEQEQQLDQRRRGSDPGYSLTRHVDVLIALMGEAQLLSQKRSTTEKNGRPPLPETAQFKPIDCKPGTAAKVT